MKAMRKATLGPAAIAALLRPIMLQAPAWVMPTMALMHGDPAPFNACVAAGDVPSAVQPVIARLAEGKTMRLDGRPRKHGFKVELKVWLTTMCMRHLGARATEAEQTAAAETGLTAGQVHGINQDFTRMGFGLAEYREIVGAEALAAIEPMRRH